jgi:hypothetical protein
MTRRTGRSICLDDTMVITHKRTLEAEEELQILPESNDYTAAPAEKVLGLTTNLTACLVPAWIQHDKL